MAELDVSAAALSEALSFPLVTSSKSNTSTNSNTAADALTPTLRGNNHICSSSEGIVYRYGNHKIEALDSSLKVLGSTSVPGSANTTASDDCFDVSCSFDNRLLVVSMPQVGLLCYNILTNNSGGATGTNTEVTFTQRWNLELVGNTVRFSPSDHRLISIEQSSITSSGSVIHICDAACATSGEVIRTMHLHDATTADWWSGSSNSTSLVVGNRDGSIQMVDSQTCAILSDLSSPCAFPCTYLKSYPRSYDNNTPAFIAAGFYNITRDDEDDDDDSDDEDEPGRHETEFAIYTLDADPNEEWNVLGDITPFFSIPRGGKHVFFTASTIISKLDHTLLLMVGSNLTNELSTLLYDRRQKCW
eukprot:CAMPEP_0194400136 /NCGR_PEP_ID=MMETSP0174-20130528/127041_1 /TAXON_ID=216777 /ORGANISM="Proboscia alata, Strain PI-D3" /LENGTH=359 /DNA_ID=CAMNT_0039196609 /DNA_START=172 /DNA_END=1248 /DNA_ORIENTATION=+